MVDLLIVRHAKTEWNNCGKIQGRSDIPLADQSRNAVTEASAALSGRRIDAAFSSPLSRATETAALLLRGRGIDAIPDPRLIERDFGELEGKTYDELGLPDHTDLFYALEDATGAESGADVFARVRSFVLDLLDRYDGKTVLVVSHGVCISYLIYAASHAAWEPETYELNYVKNLTVTELAVGEGA